MKYVSVDIETTGLDPTTCGVIEIAMVFDDLSDKEFDPVVKSWLIDPGVCKWEPNALEMHTESGLASRWAEANPTMNVRVWRATQCGVMLGRRPVAGKNFWSFDANFLGQDWCREAFGHRGLDPAILFLQTGELRPPNLATCMDRAGLAHDGVTHLAAADAYDVCRCLRVGLNINTPDELPPYNPNAQEEQE